MGSDQDRETTMSTPKYRVIRPNAGIVSVHRTLSGAQRSLARQQKGSYRQGGYCQDVIEVLDPEDGNYYPLEETEQCPS